MKKIITILILLGLFVSFCACENSNSKYNSNTNQNNNKNDNLFTGNPTQTTAKTTQNTTAVVTNPPVYQMDVPVWNFDEKTKRLEWNVVPHADFYTIDINGEKYTTQYTYMDLSHLIKGTYNVLVTPNSYNSTWIAPLCTTKPLNIKGINATEAAQKVKSTYIKSCVKVTIEYYNTFLGITTEKISESSQGVVLYKNDSVYGILTRNTLWSIDQSYDKFKVTIEDYKGNKYDGSRLGMTGKYEGDDLRWVCFETKKAKTPLPVLETASYNATCGQDIILMKLGPANYSHFGEIKSPINVRFDNVPSTTNFYTTNITEKDTRGCPVLNDQYKIIGISMGNLKDGSNYIIPIEEMKIYLK